MRVFIGLFLVTHLTFSLFELMSKVYFDPWKWRVQRNGGSVDGMSAVRRNAERNLFYQVLFLLTLAFHKCLRISSITQACLQGIFFISELIIFFILSPNARNKFELFLMSTVAWCTVHAMDGFNGTISFYNEIFDFRFIVLSCNREFRGKIKMAFSSEWRYYIISAQNYIVLLASNSVRMDVCLLR